MLAPAIAGGEVELLGGRRDLLQAFIEKLEEAGVSKAVVNVHYLADAIEALGIDPADAAPDYWRHVHNRLSAGLEPRGYTAAQHRAWLLRQACPPDPLTLRAASAGSVS